MPTSMVATTPNTHHGLTLGELDTTLGPCYSSVRFDTPIAHSERALRAETISMRTEIHPLNERYAKSGQIAFVTLLRYDVQVAHPDVFAQVVGATP